MSKINDRIERIIGFAGKSVQHSLREEIYGSGSVVLVLDCQGCLYRYGSPPAGVWERTGAAVGKASEPITSYDADGRSHNPFHMEPAEGG